MDVVGRGRPAGNSTESRVFQRSSSPCGALLQRDTTPSRGQLVPACPRNPACPLPTGLGRPLNRPLNRPPATRAPALVGLPCSECILHAPSIRDRVPALPLPPSLSTCSCASTCTSVFWSEMLAWHASCIHAPPCTTTALSVVSSSRTAHTVCSQPRLHHRVHSSSLNKHGYHICH